MLLLLTFKLNLLVNCLCWGMFCVNLQLQLKLYEPQVNDKKFFKSKNSFTPSWATSCN